MPRDYSKTVLYKIVCKDINITDCYVGHTTNFNNRKRSHKTRCNNFNDKNYNSKQYHYIRENGGWDNWSLIKIEDYPCNDKIEATKREGYWIKELKSSLNSNIAGRECKEWYEDNKDKCKEWYQEYKIKNKKLIKERKKYHYNNNKEIILEKNKKYRDNNKEKINEKKKEIIKCECGCEIVKNNLKRHQQTKKHINLISNN